MRIFYRLMLYLSELELAVAKSAPVRNPKVIKACEDDVSRWALALIKKEVKLFS